MKEKLKGQSSPYVYGFLIAVLAGIFWLLVEYEFFGADFYYIFYPMATAFRETAMLLYIPGQSNGFYYPPHTLYYWIILSLFPVAIANALHRMLTLSFLFAASKLWSKYSRWDIVIVTLAIANLHTMDHWIRGQMDAMAMVGLVLAFVATKERQPFLLGLGATIAMIKPTNMALPMLLIAWELRSWHWRDILKAATVPILTFLSTFIIFDLEWLIRYMQKAANLRTNSYTIITIWELSRIAEIPRFLTFGFVGLMLLGLLKNWRFTAEIFALAISISYLISPYAASYHYVALIPAIMGIRSRMWVVLLWFLSFLPLLRVLSGEGVVAALLYPIAVTMALLWQIARGDSVEDEKPKEALSHQHSAKKWRFNCRDILLYVR